MRSLLTVFTILILSSSITAQKRVIVEKFTSAFCGSCPNAAIMIEQLQEDYPGTIWVSHHKPTWWTDYKLQNDQSDALWEELDVLGTPRGMVDRTPIGNQLVISSGAWENQVAQQINEPHYANLEVENVDYDLENRAFSFDINVNFEQAPPAGNLHLSAIILEDSVTGTEQHNYFNEVAGHPLEGLGDIIWNYHHRNVTRAILDSPWGTANVFPETPEAGSNFTQSYTYTVPEEYNPEQIKVVALLSYYDEASFTNRQALNATEAAMRDFGLVLTSAKETILPSHALEIFPNPAKEVLQLRFSVAPTIIQVFNTQGQLVKQIPESEWYDAISLNQFKAGLYYLQFSTEEGQLTKKFTVVK